MNEGIEIKSLREFKKIQEENLIKKINDHLSWYENRIAALEQESIEEEDLIIRAINRGMMVTYEIAVKDLVGILDSMIFLEGLEC